MGRDGRKTLQTRGCVNKGEGSVCLRDAVDWFGTSRRSVRWRYGRLGEKIGQFTNDNDNDN